LHVKNFAQLSRCNEQYRIPKNKKPLKEKPNRRLLIAVTTSTFIFATTRLDSFFSMILSILLILLFSGLRGSIGKLIRNS